MDKKTYTIERTFMAERAFVWRAITEKDLMKQWYFDLPEFKAEVGFVFEVTGGEEGGTQYLHRCEVTEVVVNELLTYSWAFVGYEGISYLTFELSDDGPNTKLRITHAGIETFPANNPDFAFENFIKGWDNIVNLSLKTFLEK